MSTDSAYARTDCPSCGALLEPLPRAKKACPSCRAPIYVRSGPDGLRHLLREADLEAHEARWSDYHDRRWWIDRASDFADEPDLLRVGAMLQSQDPSYTIRDAYWKVANDGLLLVLASGDWHTASMAYYSMALTAYGEADEPAVMPKRCVRLIREAGRAQLRSYLLLGIERVERIAWDGPCPVCGDANGKVVDIQAEIARPPLPHEGCPNGWSPPDYAPIA